MKLIGYEIKKLIGIKYLWIILLIMAFLCSGAFYAMNDGNDVYGKKIVIPPDADINPLTGEFREAGRKVAEKYGQNSEYLDTVLEELIEYDEERELALRTERDRLADLGLDDDAFAEAIARFTAEYPPFEDGLDMHYSNGEPINDGELIYFSKTFFTESDKYDAYIDNIVRTTERNLRRIKLRGGEGTPAHEYQLHFKALYESIDGAVDISGIKPTEGWHRFFSFDMVTAFVFVYLTLAAGAVFLHERSCGTLLLIRTSRRGRLATVAAKLPSLALLCVVAVAVFTLSAAIPCAVMYGFSDPSMPFQSCLDDLYWNCPYTVSLGGGMALIFAMRCFCAFSFACIVAFAAAVFLSPPVTYGVGAVVMLVNMVVNYFITYNNKIKLNLVGMSSASALRNYSEIYVFGHYYSTLTVGAFLFASLAAVSVFFVLFAGTKRHAAKSIAPPRIISRTSGVLGVFGKIWRRVRDTFARVKTRGSRAADAVFAGKKARARVMRGDVRSLFVWECRKLLTLPILASILLLAAASAMTSCAYYNDLPITHSRSTDNYIIENWFGIFTDGKYTEYSDMLSYAESGTDSPKYIEMETALEEGDITQEEFDAYFSIVKDAPKSLRKLEAIEEKAKYLHETKAATGIDGWLIPTDRLELLIGRSVNIWRAAAVILIFSRMFAPDYSGRISEGNFASILYTTKRGRRRSFRAKMCAAFVISLALSIVFEASDFMIGASQTTNLRAMLNAPVLSVQGYETFGDGLTVGRFLALSLLIRTAGTLLLAYLTCASSFLTKKVQATLVVSAIVTLLPYALVYMGVRALRYVDLTAALSGGRLLSRSAEFAAFGGIYGFAIALLAVYAMIAAAAVLYVRRRTGK